MHELTKNKIKKKKNKSNNNNNILKLKRNLYYHENIKWIIMVWIFLIERKDVNNILRTACINIVIEIIVTKIIQ